MDAGGSALLGLRTGLKGHGSQHQRRRTQCYRELSHQTLLLFAGPICRTDLQDCRISKMHDDDTRSEYTPLQ
jgi:hypothetical protein